MKILFIVASMLISSMAFANQACPNLQGNYFCYTSHGGTQNITIRQAPARGSMAYKIEGGWGSEDTVLADGKVHTSISDGGAGDFFPGGGFVKTVSQTRCVRGKVVSRFQKTHANDRNFKQITMVDNGVKMLSQRQDGNLMIRTRGTQNTQTYKGTQSTPYEVGMRCRRR